MYTAHQGTQSLMGDRSFSDRESEMDMDTVSFQQTY